MIPSHFRVPRLELNHWKNVFCSEEKCIVFDFQSFFFIFIQVRSKLWMNVFTKIDYFCFILKQEIITVVIFSLTICFKISTSKLIGLKLYILISCRIYETIYLWIKKIRKQGKIFHFNEEKKHLKFTWRTASNNMVEWCCVHFILMGNQS